MGTIHHQKNPTGTWDYDTVRAHVYEGGAAPGAVRRILIGRDEGAQDFIIRYFTIPPGGHSSYESHAHPHGVIIVQGGGQVLLGDTWHPIAVGDAVFIEPNEIHQFKAPPDQPLGFICVIPPKREPTANTNSGAASQG